MTDDIKIADGIKEGFERDRIRREVLEGIEDNLLPEHAAEAERMLLRAWLLGQEIVHIEYHNGGSVADYVGFETAEAEDCPRMGDAVDRYDLRPCESPADVFRLLNL